MPKVETIYIGGPSGAGTSTAVAGLHIPEFEPVLAFTERFTTRETLPGETGSGIKHVSPEEFEAIKPEAELSWSWKLDINQPTNQYALLSEGPGIQIREVNSGFLERTPEEYIAGGYNPDNSFAILLWATRQERRKRLEAKFGKNSTEASLRVTQDPVSRPPGAVEWLDTSPDWHTGPVLQKLVQNLVRGVIGFNKGIDEFGDYGSYQQHKYGVERPVS